MHKTHKIVLASLLSIALLSSCGEYVRVQKSNDIMEKLSYAKKYYNTKKYNRTIELLEEITPYFKGRSEAEQVNYMLAESYFKSKNYDFSHQYFRQYYTSHPTGEHQEYARYMSGYALFLNSPDVRLDQAMSLEAINELQLYLDYFPTGAYADDAKKILFELQEKLALKELLAARLYYNLGNYLFNNYLSCIITSRNAIKDYPYSQYKEEFSYLILASLYEIAYNSVESKKGERVRELRDEYYSYLNEYPNGAFIKQTAKFKSFIDKMLPQDDDLVDAEEATKEETAEEKA
ncbi:MAG: outer membrane protein assembly factor BamD [Porphyromonas sp.]|nr:outer membrane protein assembly factor BamD [Porphyromonas sp.]